MFWLVNNILTKLIAGVIKKICITNKTTECELQMISEHPKIPKKCLIQLSKNGHFEIIELAQLWKSKSQAF